MAKAKDNPKFICRDNSHQLRGKLYEVFETQRHSDKFSTRKFVIDATYAHQDNLYENFPLFQLVNGQCDLIDVHAIGDDVIVHFRITGTGSRDANNAPVVYTNLNAYRIESVPPPAVQVENTISNDWMRQPLDQNTTRGTWGEAADDLPF